MIRYLALPLALTAAPALAQTVTSATKLPDSNGDGQITVEKMAAALRVPKKTVLFDCGSKTPPFVYAVGSLDKCPAQIETIKASSTRPDTLLGTNGAIPLPNCRPVRIVGAYRVVETYSTGTYRNITCSGLIGEGIKREGIRLRGKVENVTIENFRLIHDDAPNVSPHLPAGIHVETGTNVTIRNGVVSGYRMTMPKGRYINGDGIATELKTAGTITNVVSSDNSDGGFDIKGQWHLDNLTAERNGHYSYRLWGQVTAGTLISINPGQGHVEIAGKTTEATIDKLVAVGGQPLVVFSVSGGKVAIGSCDLSKWTGTVLVKGKGTFTRGPTCKLP